MNQNFGPINKPGGDKRLNVAFSRARCEMMKLFGYTKVTAKVTEGTAMAIKVARSMGAIGVNKDRKYVVI